MGIRMSEEKLPVGWKISPIGSIAEVNPRKPPNDALPPDADVSFVPMKAVDADDGMITDPENRPYAKVRKGYTAFRDGDVIFAKITPCMENGKAAIAGDLVNGYGFGSSEFHVFRPTSSILAKYLFYFLRQRTFRLIAEANMTGSVGQKRVPTTFVKEYPIPYPPLPEQKRIVAKLYEIMAEIKAAKGHLARAKELIRKFRQSVLNAAVTGKLTEEWRREHPEVKPAAETVLEIHKHRDSLISDLKIRDIRRGRAIESSKWRGAPLSNPLEDECKSGWCETRIGDISECLDRLRVPISKDERNYRKGTVPYFGANGQVGWIDDWIFDEELVLVVEDETFVGRTKPFSYTISGRTWVNNHAHVLAPLGSISANYLNICLSFYDFIPLTSGSTGRRKLNQSDLMPAPLEIAPVAEQDEIVKRVKRLFALSGAIDHIIDTTGSKNDRLLDAILSITFRGELN